MSNLTISSFDEEILKALTVADDLRKELVCNSASEIRCNTPFQIKDSERVTSESDSTIDSVFLKSSDLGNESFKYDSEFQAVSQDIEELHLRNVLFNERKRKLEAETKSHIEKAMSSSDEIISYSILEQRLHSILLAKKHIEAIVNQVSRIKQVLQDERKSSLKVSPSCQKYVIQFFQVVGDIIEKMRLDMDLFENSQNSTTKVIPINESALLSNFQDILGDLARRVDLFAEFRCHLSSAEDLESGIELGSSELLKSEQPQLQNQLSSRDSGIC